MGRYWQHRNKSLASPGAFIFFDTETRPHDYPDDPDCELHKLRLGVAHYLRLERGKRTREDVLRFTNEGEFWNWLLTKLHKRIPTWVWTHNLAFDLTVVEFWKHLEAGLFTLTDPDQEDGGDQSEGRGNKWSTGWMLLEDPPTVISCRVPGRGRLIFVDTMNFFATSLEAMGKALGHDKMQMPKFSEPDDVWFPYCENDVHVLRECVMGLVAWVKENELGRFRYTAPAQAMSAYRHRFMKWPVEYHDEPDVRRLERACYYGGRLECFYLGKVGKGKQSRGELFEWAPSLFRLGPRGPISELDVCSLYPFVMREHDYPQRLVDSSFERGGVGDWRKELAGDCAAVVMLNTDTGFPVRDEDIGTYFPVGTYWTALAGPELATALELGVVVDCSAWSRYHLAPMFGEFVDYFWDKRHEYEQTGNRLYGDLCKLMPNSFYGKWGQKSAQWCDCPGLVPPVAWGPWIVDDVETNTRYVYRIIGGNVQRRDDCGELVRTSPAIAAWVTSHGREYLRTLINVAGAGNVLYVVTDALYVTPAGKARLEHAGLIGDRVMGKLTVKYESRTCEIRGLHHVTLGKSVKHGSIKAKAKKVGSQTWEEIHFQNMQSIIAGRTEWRVSTDADTGRRCKERVVLPPLAGVLVYPIRKTIALDYKRGRVTQSGWVEPLTLNDERNHYAQIDKMGVGLDDCGK